MSDPTKQRWRPSNPSAATNSSTHQSSSRNHQLTVGPRYIPLGDHRYKIDGNPADFVNLQQLLNMIQDEFPEFFEDPLPKRIKQPTAPDIATYIAQHPRARTRPTRVAPSPTTTSGVTFSMPKSSFSTGITPPTSFLSTLTSAPTITPSSSSLAGLSAYASSDPSDASDSESSYDVATTSNTRVGPFSSTNLPSNTSPTVAIATPTYLAQSAFDSAHSQYLANLHIILKLNNDSSYKSEKIFHIIDRHIGSQFQEAIRYLKPTLQVREAF